MRQLRLSQGTPVPSSRDRARFQLLVEPPNRAVMNGWFPKTVGESLDTRPKRCSIRRLMYKADLQRVTYLAQSCRSPLCSGCVVGWLQDRAGPAWVFWGGAAVMVPASEDRNSARDLGLRTRGPDSTPGILSVPLDDGSRGLFVPVGAVDGFEVRGPKLDEALIRVLRAIRLDDPTTRTPRPPAAHTLTIPSYMTADHVNSLAATAGVGIDIKGVRHRVALSVTQEAFDMLRMLVRGRA